MDKKYVELMIRDNRIYLYSLENQEVYYVYNKYYDGKSVKKWKNITYLFAPASATLLGGIMKGMSVYLDSATLLMFLILSSFFGIVSAWIIPKTDFVITDKIYLFKERDEIVILNDAMKGVRVVKAVEIILIIVFFLILLSLGTTRDFRGMFLSISLMFVISFWYGFKNRQSKKSSDIDFTYTHKVKLLKKLKKEGVF